MCVQLCLLTKLCIKMCIDVFITFAHKYYNSMHVYYAHKIRGLYIQVQSQFFLSPLSLSLLQATNNTVVVTSQPTPQVHTVYHRGNSEYGLPAIIFAVAITVCFLSLGCWHAILCSAIGIALAVGVSNTGMYKHITIIH